MQQIFLYRLAQWLIDVLPHDGSLWLAERLAELWWRRAATDRAAVVTNLSIILGQPVREDAPMVLEVFRNFTRYLTEFLSAHHFRRSAMVIDGCEEAAATLRTTPRAIILSAHLGNWELGAMALRQLGFSMSVVALLHRDPRVNRLFDRQRQRCGVDVIPLGVRAMQRGLAVLRRGGLLGIAGDREFGSNGIPVSFFGRRVMLPRGPALLSLRTGAPVIPVFFIRKGPGRFRLTCGPQMWPPAFGAKAGRSEGPSSGAPVQQLTQRYGAVIEHYVTQFPSQWLMFQPVFGEPTIGMADCGLPSGD